MGFGKKLVLVIFIFCANISLATSQEVLLERNLNTLSEYKSNFRKNELGSSDLVEAFLDTVVDGITLNTTINLEEIYSRKDLEKQVKDLQSQVSGLQTLLALLKADIIALGVAVGNK